MKNSPLARVITARSVLTAIATAAAFAAAGAAQALPNQLVSNATASVTGGCNGCGHSQDQTTFTLSTLTSTASDSGLGGSFGHADVTTLYGEQHAKTSAFWAASDPGPDVQTLAFSEYDENFAPGTFGPGPYNLTFNVSGTLSAQPAFGPGSGAYINWDWEGPHGTISSNTVVFGSGSTSLVIPVFVPVNDATSLRVEFQTYAYAGDRFSGATLSADFSHTARTYIDAVNGGPDVIGQSGHDYATPTAAGGVPEPAAWALMLVGFGGLGAALRRRRSERQLLAAGA